MALLQHTPTNGPRLPSFRSCVVSRSSRSGCCSRPVIRTRAPSPLPARPLLDGGRPAFEAFLAKQRGRPVVVNKWASWCGPCRTEFPLFRDQAKRARASRSSFLGVDSDDDDGQRAEVPAGSRCPSRHFEDRDARDRHVVQRRAELPHHSLLRLARASSLTCTRAATSEDPTWRGHRPLRSLIPGGPRPARGRARRRARAARAGVLSASRACRSPPTGTAATARPRTSWRSTAGG